MRERRSPPKRKGTQAPLFTEAQLRKPEGRKEDIMLTLESGPIPTTCPCGRGIDLASLDRLRERGKDSYACPVCSRRWGLSADADRKILEKVVRVPREQGVAANRGPGAASTPPAGTPFSGSVDLEAETLTIAVHLHKAGDTRQVKDYEVSVTATEGENPEKESLLLGKRLYEKEATYKAICSHDTATTTGLDAMAFPRTNDTARGVRRYPLSRVDEVFSWLEKRAARRMELVEAFIADYPNIVERARKRLGGVFNPGQFFGARVNSEGVLSVAGHEPGLWERFGGKSIEGMIEVRPLSNSLPASLQSVSSKLYERASADAAQRATREVDSMVKAMREMFATYCQQLIDRLKAKAADGSAVFRDSNLENLKQFLAGFSDINRTLKDGTLAGLVEKANAVLDGVSVDDLKGDKTVQATVLKTLEAGQAEIALLGVVPKPKRQVRLTDDE